MRKRLVKLVLAVGVIMALAIPVGAADLHPQHLLGLQGEFDCGTVVTHLHFVNNQTGPQTGDGWLYIELDDSTTIVTAAEKRNRNNQQWRVAIPSGSVVVDVYTLENDDITEMPGRLVISDYRCKFDKKDVTREP